MILSLFHALAIRIIPLLLETVSTNPGVTVGVEGGGGSVPHRHHDGGRARGASNKRGT